METERRMTVRPDGYTVLFTCPVFGDDPRYYNLDAARATYRLLFESGVDYGMQIIHVGDILCRDGERRAQWFVQMGATQNLDDAGMGEYEWEAVAAAFGEYDMKAPYVYTITEDTSPDEELMAAMLADEEAALEAAVDEAAGLGEQMELHRDADLVLGHDGDEVVGKRGDEVMGEEEDEIVSEDEDEVTGKSRDAGAGEHVGPGKDGADDVEEQITTSVTASTDTKMHAFPCVVPSCGERPSRLHMNRRTDLILHLKDAHKCKLHYARGGPSDKTKYNRVQNKQVREWMNSNGWAWEGTIFADGADD